MEDPRYLMKLRYASNSRVKYLHEEQMKIMKELNVPVLDLFEATYLSGDQHPVSDGVHYRVPFNKLILSYFYKSENQTL
jgi:lysophospholipase L1-like esterase